MHLPGCKTPRAPILTTASKGSIAYFGTYTVSGDTLKLHIESGTFPNWDNTDQTRIVRLSGNQFSWENSAGSAGGNIKLLFEQVK